MRINKCQTQFLPEQRHRVNYNHHRLLVFPVRLTVIHYHSCAVYHRLLHVRPHPIDCPVSTLQVVALPLRDSSASPCRWPRCHNVQLSKSFKISIPVAALSKVPEPINGITESNLARRIYVCSCFSVLCCHSRDVVTGWHYIKGFQSYLQDLQERY